MIDIDTISLLCSLDRQNASTTKKEAHLQESLLFISGLFDSHFSS